MNIFSLLFKIFLIYLLYKLIFDFIIPVYRTTRQMKRKMSEMQQKMHEHHSNNAAQNAEPEPRKKSQVAGDYIDYEEIK